MTDDHRARLNLLVQQMELGPLAEAGRSPSDAFGAPGSTSAGGSATGRPRGGRAERRLRARHKVAATVELAEVGSNEPVRANLADLGRGGCYVKLDDPFPLGTAVEISITKNGKSFHSRATVTYAETGRGMGLVFTAIAPEELLVLDEWLTASKERTWLASNRRRSQRMMVNIPVHVAAKDHTGSVISERTKTISVSPNGALLQLEMPVTKGQTLLLRNAVTKDALECSVDYLGATRNGRREVGVSFVLPNRTLWQIAFPPADWSPQDPYAKRA